MWDVACGFACLRGRREGPDLDGWLPIIDAQVGMYPAAAVDPRRGGGRDNRS